MASVTNKEIPEIFDMMGEYFNLYKKYYQPEKEDKYWNERAEAFKAFVNKYQTKFALELAEAALHDIDARREEEEVI